MTRKVLASFLFGGPVIRTWPAEFGLLILRLWAGLGLALIHGRAKVFDPAMFDQFTAGVAELGFPFPTASAWFAALGEFLGGLLLAAGLFTRPAALWIAAVMATAAFGVHTSSFTGEAELSAAVPALSYLAMALCFAFAGSSRTGLDQLIWRRYILSGHEAELANFERRRDALAQATAPRAR